MFTTGYITGGWECSHNTNVKSVKIELHNHLRCFVRRMTVKMMVMMMVMMVMRVMVRGTWWWGGWKSQHKHVSRQDGTWKLFALFHNTKMTAMTMGQIMNMVMLTMIMMSSKMNEAWFHLLKMVFCVITYFEGIYNDKVDDHKGWQQ